MPDRDPTHDALLRMARCGLPIAVVYHPDSDPGDGTGWCGEVGDWHTYGSLGSVIAAMEGRLPDTAGRIAGGVPDATGAQVVAAEVPGV
jgi:hypothetical protein